MTAAADRDDAPEGLARGMSAGEILKRGVRSRRPPLRRALRRDAEMYARQLGLEMPGGRLRSALVMMRIWRTCEDYPAVVLYRLRCWCEDRSIPLAPLLLRGLLRVCYSVRIGRYVVIGEGLYIAHGNVVVDGLTTIGRNCVVAPWVTIGLQRGNFVGPRIGDRVFVGTGASILGELEVGSGAVIAAGAVVVDDVPAGTTVAGAPARPVSSQAAG